MDKVSTKIIGMENDELVSVQVEGKAVRNLLLHRGVGAHEHTWVITHIPTGRRIMWFYIRDLAFGCMIELAYSENWNTVSYETAQNTELQLLVENTCDRWKAIEARVRTGGKRNG